jgi:hypothetical protein
LSAQDDARAVDELRFPPLEVRKGDVLHGATAKPETHAKSSTGWSSIAFGATPRWPQPWSRARRDDDRIEARLHRQLCLGGPTLRRAQAQEIAYKHRRG